MCFYVIFRYLPFVFALIVFFAHVVPCGYRRPGRFVWCLVLLLCAVKFIVYRLWGGDSFSPTLPEGLLWTWNTLYSALALFALFSVLLLPLKAVAPFRREGFLRFERVLTPLSALGLAVWGVWCGLRPPDVVEREVFFDGLPPALDGYRIAHLSDLHVSCAARGWRTAEIVRRTNAAKPDLVCITGDIADGMPSVLRDDVRPIAGLHATDGTFACTGNHEAYWPWRAWSRLLGSCGVRVLSNDCAVPRAELAVGGTDDRMLFATHQSASDGPHPETAFERAPAAAFRIWLEHVPMFAAGHAQAARANLILSGHTHGGVAPVLKTLTRIHNGGFLRGMYSLGPGMVLHVSPGSGQWASFPVRFLNPSEITLIVLRAGKSAE